MRSSRGGRIGAGGLVGGLCIGLGALALPQTAARADEPGSDNVLGRMVGIYVKEWGKPPADPEPGSPPTRRPESELPPAPQSIPPFPFSDWPMGGYSYVGATAPNTQGGALMKALAPTSTGKWLNENNIEIYGWLNGGCNVSNAKNHTSGNYPAAYSYKPNECMLDQAVVYVERLPNTVQKDHLDWGFRMSAIYGETYKYTTAIGIDSYQLQKQNAFRGYDFPMMYGELYIPQVAQGMVIRVGRFIAIPDIEAQLAPNNYMYSHSMTYGYDNYTTQGIYAGIQLNKNWSINGGILTGTEVSPWVASATDEGKRLSTTAGIRWTSDSAYDSIYLNTDGINNGTWGYNNLQWYGGTYYHKFDEKWHISFEAYTMHQNNVLATTSSQAGQFDGPSGAVLPDWRNAPFRAHCPVGANSCMANMYTALTYLNYKFSPMDNISWRAEFYNDIKGQRTGTDTRYLNYAIGWQHWLSPSVTIRPEIAWYNSLDRPGFDNTCGIGCGNTQSHITVVSGDVIWHF